MDRRRSRGRFLTLLSLSLSLFFSSAACYSFDSSAALRLLRLRFYIIRRIVSTNCLPCWPSLNAPVVHLPYFDCFISRVMDVSDRVSLVYFAACGGLLGKFINRIGYKVYIE